MEKKTAERLLLELRDKLGSIIINSDKTLSVSASDNDILNALLSLGYNDREASWAIKQVLSANTTVSDGIRKALQLLSKEK